MFLGPDGLTLAATDLSNFLACRRKTALDLSVARGERKRPHFHDPVVEILRQRGDEHEKRFVQAERERGFDIADLSHIDRRDRQTAVAATLDAMRCGAARIIQGAVVSADRQWFGIADVLRRVDTPCALGRWSYEALDTKLAQETRAATMLQLALYSELLAEAQGLMPAFFHVVTPVHEEQYRVADYAAYFRLMRCGLLDNVGGPARPLPYPEPTSHCAVCDWASQCTAELRRDDHLSFVANCSRPQRTELAAQGIRTLAALGRDGLPASFRPSRGAVATYQRLQHQARLQFEARERGAPAFEVLSVEPDLGLCLLPEPSPGDVFLDLEGATFAREGGREYLFGVVTIGRAGAPAYESFQAFDDAQERQAFETVVDRVIAALDRDPGMHVYHYAPYEPAALKRLMGRYATRGPELDRLLRAERFVDLYGVMRHALRAGVEHYSIKNLEVFYGYVRDVPLEEAGRNRRLVEYALDLGSPDLVKPEEFDVVRGYNRDDCVSTLRLRDWLEGLRAEAVARGGAVPRPTIEIKADPKIGELAQRARDLRDVLLKDLPADPADWSDEDRARWLLAYTGDWHTREWKASWWEYYRLRDLPPEDQADEPMAVVGLEFVERVDVKVHKKTGKPTGTVTDRYKYAPRQEMEIDEGDSLTLADETDWGTVAAVDRVAKTIDVQKGPKVTDVHATSAFSFFNVPTEVIQRSVLAFADDVVANGLSASPDCRRDLLLRRPPRLVGTPFEAHPGEDEGAFAKRIAPALDHTVLAIQGPPGTGKTFTGAEMICALVAAGRKVGVTATSHKVIRNLLKGVVKEATKTRAAVRVAHKLTEKMNDGSSIIEETDNAKALALIRDNQADVLGGVAWLWASDKAVQAVDVLFVDEAGQMSLANVLGAARAAQSIVLLGDQQQLDQPSKASHPEGVSVSALDHVLAGERTMPAGRGIFLPCTRRLAPGIAAFTSEVFYEGRLQALPELANQRLAHVSPFDAGALWILPVAHTGNQSYSSEEVEAVADLVARLVAGPSQWIDREGVAAPLRAEHILVVTPYNAQVSRLSARLPGVHVGTVDKFQGQEAPVIIYSMATSSPDDAPRGMEFLYSLNRLNVATSRARCAAIVVASPLLFEPDCRTPRQMKLANALCRYREMAQSAPAMTF